MVLRQQQLGRVAHLSQTILSHLVDAQLRRAAETVLDAAQDAIHVMLIALELQHRIDNVLQYLRAGDAAFLVDMADQEDRDTALLGILQDHGAALTHLRDAAGRGFHQLREDGLNRVDDQQIGLDIRRLRKDLLQVGFAEDEALRIVVRQPISPQLQLPAALLARDIERLPLRQPQDGLQHQRRFTDARLSADQHQGALHQAATQHPVQLHIVKVDAFLRLRRDVAQQLGTVMSPFHHARHRAFDDRLFRDNLLHVGVPLATIGALPHPFRRGSPTIGTNINRLSLCHYTPGYRITICTALRCHPLSTAPLKHVRNRSFLTSAPSSRCTYSSGADEHLTLGWKPPRRPRK